MKILVDATPLYSGPLTGIGYYTQSLLSGFSTDPRVDIKGYAFNFLKRKPSTDNISIQEQAVIPGKLLNYPRYAGVELPLEFFFKTRGFDLILGTNYLLPPSVRKIPSISTIHDLCFHDHPEWVQSKNAHILKKMLHRTIARSSGVITISQFSLSRIREIYDYSGPALVVDIPPKTSMETGKRPSQISLEPGHFFLFVGTIEPRKNLGLALDAFEKLPKTIQYEFPFVLAGKPGWDAEVLERLRSDKNPNIHYLDYVSENERTWLYQNATVTIVPSHYEGFGMMTLESLALGTPTTTSDIPPQREILGASGQYFDPANVAGLVTILNKFTDPGYRARALKDQLPMLRNYSWDNVVNKTIEFMCDVAV
jgi:glycosyltransferase involved in cell wall biosynthesis